MNQGLIAEGGPFMWLLLIFLLTILVLSAKKVYELYFTKNENSPRLERGINSILFLGVLSLAFGILAQITGIYNALGAIIRASDISPQITMMGLRQSFITTLFGFWILIIAAISWFALRTRYKSITTS